MKFLCFGDYLHYTQYTIDLDISIVHELNVQLASQEVNVLTEGALEDKLLSVFGGLSFLQLVVEVSHAAFIVHVSAGNECVVCFFYLGVYNVVIRLER